MSVRTEVIESRVQPTAEDIAKGVPEKVPSIVELKKALPAHCFQPVLSKSLSYVARDALIVGGLYLSMLAMEMQPIRWLTWMYTPVYWYLQGTMFAAIFVLGHDCGHESFSSSALINDIFGNLLHMSILVPYYPWKLTHRHHHKNTGNIDKDEVFYPVRESEAKLEGTTNFALPYFGFGIGWIAYALRGYTPRPVSLFNPFQPFFARHVLHCTISLALFYSWIAFALVPYAQAFGFARLASHYLMPVFGFSTWIVLITFLHHHDENVPWYADSKWDYVRGQLSSIDRHYGWVHGILHNIGTHQMHHMFSKIPHYYLEDATTAFRKAYPHLVRTSEERLFPAYFRLFKMYAKQCYIKDDALIHVYTPEEATKSKDT